jgi:hypothetical protein
MVGLGRAQRSGLGRVTTCLLVLGGALVAVPLGLPAGAQSQIVTTSFVSGAGWAVFDADPGMDPDGQGPGFLGAAQNVCLNQSFPSPCPTGATIYGYPGFGWTADLSGIPKAAWIAAPGIDGSTPGADLAEFFFSRAFDLVGEPIDGTVQVAADDLVDVRVNGTVVGTSGSVTDPVVAAAANQQVAPIDITAFLVPGRNVITLHSQNGPATFPGCPQACTFAQNPTGLVFGGRLRSAPDGPLEAEISVLPSGNLHLGDAVLAHVSQVTPNAQFEIVLCADPGPTDEVCSGTLASSIASDNGDFETVFSIPRAVEGHDCSLPSTPLCELSLRAVNAPDVVLAVARVVFSPYRSDGQVRRRSDGVLLGDNDYDRNAEGQTRVRRVSQGEKWTFAIRVENDGAVTDSIRVQSIPQASAVVPVQYFFDFFDIGAAMTGDGFVFADLAPGESRVFAVRFDVPADAEVDQASPVHLRFTSLGDPVPPDDVVVSVIPAPAPS